MHQWCIDRSTKATFVPPLLIFTYNLGILFLSPRSCTAVERIVRLFQEEKILSGRGAKRAKRKKEEEKTIEKGAWIARLGRATTFLIVDRLYSRIQPLSTRSCAHASICDSIVCGLQLASESFCRNWSINSCFYIFYKIKTFFRCVFTILRFHFFSFFFQFF